MILIFKTKNTNAFSSIDNPGSCSGMSANWAKASLTYGGVRYAGMLSTAAANIAASAYMLMPAAGDSERVIEANNLVVGAHAQHGGPAPITVATVVNGLVALAGTYVWSLDFMGGGGHFMGWRNDAAAGKIEFFDPNYGLYSFDSVADVQANLPGLIGVYGLISEFETWEVTSN